jgi:phage shock protein PspC (stress-responsive transcriptional regulator)
MRLAKDNENGIICGVLAGFAKHIGEDPTLLRIFFALFTCMTGIWVGMVCYFIMAMIMPNEDDL